MSKITPEELSTILTVMTNDERNYYLKMPRPLAISFALLLILSLLWGTLMKLVIYSHYKTVKTKDHPINFYILIDLLFDHAFYLIFIPIYIIFLTAGQPIAHFINSYTQLDFEAGGFCHYLPVMSSFSLSRMTVSNFGIAIFRLLCIQKTTLVRNVIGEKNLLIIISVVSLILPGITFGQAEITKVCYHRINESFYEISFNAALVLK